MKRLYGKLYKFIIAAAVIVISLLAILGNTETYSPVYAATYVGENDFDSTAVLDDLQSSDSTFNVTDYAFNEKQETQVIAFNEYCYSYYSNQRGNYALYVYVWNPQGLNIVSNSTRNYITMRFGDDDGASYQKYRLYFCNCSTGEYQGLFYKFKVYLSSDDKTAAFETLNSLSRVYTVSELELLINGNTNATSYYVATTYTFTGYCAGYGSNDTSASTLTCKAEQTDTLSISDIGTAYYRPEGTNGANRYTQDSLYSVYFAVPNSIIDTFGYLVGISAEWYEAVLYPMLVTGDSTAYNNVCNYLGVDVSDLCETDDSFKYAFAGISPLFDTYATIGYSYGLNSDSRYNAGQVIGTIDDIGTYVGVTDIYLSTLYSAFYSGSSDDSADSYSVSTANIISALETATAANYSSYKLVAEKYADYLFESYDTEKTTYKVDMRDIDNNTVTPLTSEYIDTNIWHYIFGNDKSYVETYKNIPVIQALDSGDFEDTDEVAAESLYVNEADYIDLKDYFYKWSTKTTYTAADGSEYDTDGYTIYLFRYDVSDYTSAEASVLSKGTYWGSQCWYEESTNAYFFQESIYLDFDIIDVTFTNGKTDTVIGVVMSPIDVIATATPPVNTTDDSDSWKDTLKMVLAIIALVFVVILLFPVLPYIAKFIVWIISLPFKLINTIIKAFKKKE